MIVVVVDCPFVTADEGLRGECKIVRKDLAANRHREFRYKPVLPGHYQLSGMRQSWSGKLEWTKPPR